MYGRKKPTSFHTKPTQNFRVLVDMDDTICDFDTSFLEKYREIYPEEPFIPKEERNSFYCKEQYRALRSDLEEKAESIYVQKGFVREMKPIEGAVIALKDMKSMENIDVFLCTSPITKCLSSVTEKFEWVREYLGQDWLGRLIITDDKTMIQGDLLIDDNPCITGSIATPSWDHILFTAPHNRHIDASQLSCVYRLENWTSYKWKEIITSYLKKSH